MKLNHFKAEKVHGILKFDIIFNPELNFLIGINGSGKTSALKLILGLISPSFYYLSQLDFKSAELVCSSNSSENDILIRSNQNDDSTVSLFLKIKDVEYPEEKFPRYIRSTDEDMDLDEQSVHEQGFKDVFDSLAITKVIREMATPKFLGLDRRIYEGRLIDLRSRGRRQFIHPKYRRRYSDNYPLASSIDNSLEEVQLLIFDYYRKISSKQPQISEDFKKKIFNLSFNFVDEHNIERMPVDTQMIQDKKEKVVIAIKDLGLDYLQGYANSFFNRIPAIIEDFKNIQSKHSEGNKEIQEEELKLFRKWWNNSSQLKRIDEIINYSKQYQEQIAGLRAPLKRLEDITFNFLKESNKALLIQNDGELKVRMKNGRINSIYELSSGEKQIIIMIAHLIFEEDLRDSGVFIIDEPELSLHISWQEIFVDAITQASPKTQFILATHSPSIISKVERESLCQDLNKYNN